tara:strand:+ start:770 stop:1033 length:264 start_codon:yes stop_codon:yes gene_type:complete
MVYTRIKNYLSRKFNRNFWEGFRSISIYPTSPLPTREIDALFDYASTREETEFESDRESLRGDVRAVTGDLERALQKFREEKRPKDS